jgi:hypothetical protein
VTVLHRVEVDVIDVTRENIVLMRRQRSAKSESPSGKVQTGVVSKRSRRSAKFTVKKKLPPERKLRRCWSSAEHNKSTEAAGSAYDWYRFYSIHPTSPMMGIASAFARLRASADKSLHPSYKRL